MQQRNMWGIGATDVTKYGEADSHRLKAAPARYGKFAHDEELRALAEEAGISVKRLKRDLHIWRATGKVPTWA